MATALFACLLIGALQGRTRHTRIMRHRPNAGPRFLDDDSRTYLAVKDVGQHPLHHGAWTFFFSALPQGFKVRMRPVNSHVVKLIGIPFYLFNLIIRIILIPNSDNMFASFT